MATQILKPSHERKLNHLKNLYKLKPINDNATEEEVDEMLKIAEREWEEEKIARWNKASLADKRGYTATEEIKHLRSYPLQSWESYPELTKIEEGKYGNKMKDRMDVYKAQFNQRCWTVALIVLAIIGFMLEKHSSIY